MALDLPRKLRITLLSVLVFLAVSLPCTYRVTNALVGGTATISGTGAVSPTGVGLALHAAVFGAVTLALMYAPARA